MGLRRSAAVRLHGWRERFLERACDDTLLARWNVRLAAWQRVRSPAWTTAGRSCGFGIGHAWSIGDRSTKSLPTVYQQSAISLPNRRQTPSTRGFVAPTRRSDFPRPCRLTGATRAVLGDCWETRPVVSMAVVTQNFCRPPWNTYPMVVGSGHGSGLFALVAGPAISHILGPRAANGVAKQLCLPVLRQILRNSPLRARSRGSRDPVATLMSTLVSAENTRELQAHDVERAD